MAAPNRCLPGLSVAASLPDIGTLPEWGAGPGTPLRRELGTAFHSSLWTLLGPPQPWLHPGEKAGQGEGAASPERGWFDCSPYPDHPAQVTRTGAGKAHGAFIWWQMGAGPAEN